MTLPDQDALFLVLVPLIAIRIGTSGLYVQIKGQSHQPARLSLVSRKKSELNMGPSEDMISKELVEEELKAIVHYIEQHVHWAKLPENERFARLNMVTAECLIEAAHLIESLCERLNEA